VPKVAPFRLTMNVTVKDAFGGMKKLLAVDPPGVAMVTVDVPVAGAGFGPAAPPEKTAAAVVLSSGCSAREREWGRQSIPNRNAYCCANVRSISNVDAVLRGGIGRDGPGWG